MVKLVELRYELGRPLGLSGSGGEVLSGELISCTGGAGTRTRRTGLVPYARDILALPPRPLLRSA